MTTHFAERRETGPPLVVVSVGTDHHRFDRLVNWVERWACQNLGVRVVVQRGAAEPMSSVENHAVIPHGELCKLFADAVVVVTHGGPSTLMDARAAGRVPIVVPRDPAFGEHVDGHQLRFADHLDRHGLAKVVRREDEFEHALAEALDDPSAFTVPLDTTVPPGIVGFGRVLDDLIGAATPVSRAERVDQR